MSRHLCIYLHGEIMCTQKLFITLLRHSVSNPSISKINRVNKQLLSDPISVLRASHSIPSRSKS